MRPMENESVNNFALEAFNNNAYVKKLEKWFIAHNGEGPDLDQSEIEFICEANESCEFLQMSSKFDWLISHHLQSIGRESFWRRE